MRKLVTTVVTSVALLAAGNSFVATAQTSEELDVFDGFVRNLQEASQQGDEDATTSLNSLSSVSTNDKREIGSILKNGLLEEALFGGVALPEVSLKVEPKVQYQSRNAEDDGWTNRKEACVTAGFTEFDDVEAMKVCTGASYRTEDGEVKEVKDEFSYVEHNYNPVINMSLVDVQGHPDGELATVTAVYDAERLIEPLGWTKSATHKVQFNGSTGEVVTNEEVED